MNTATESGEDLPKFFKRKIVRITTAELSKQWNFRVFLIRRRKD